MFILNNNEAIPLYKQLYSQIREHVLSGQLPANAKLPSVRDLASELSISRNTVEGAFQELYTEGYIYSIPRSGYFVSVIDQDAAPLSLPHNPRKHVRIPAPPAYYRFDFHPARLDPNCFPVPLWRKCFLECLREGSRGFSQYTNPQGEEGLRRNIQAYLERSRGVVCKPKQIIVCAGLQQSLSIVAQLLHVRHSVVAVENPGYHLPRSVFRNHGYGIRPVPVGPNGLDLDALMATNGTIAYVTPSHQLPMGYVMPVVHRLNLIEWAESAGRFIIEDDYDSELRYHGKPIPSLQGLRPDGNIIYLGTFSKILSPALRVSYLVLPESLLADYRQVFHNYFSTVSLLEQLTLERFMMQGHWERHIRRMRTIYKKKHDALLGAVERHFGDRAVVIGQGAGLHVVLQLRTSSRDEADLIAQSLQQGIRLFPFSATNVTTETDTLKLMLGFGGMTVAEIEQGVMLLSQISM